MRGTNATSYGVADEPAVAATSDARIGARVSAEVAVAATPDTARLPVVGDVERHRLTGSLLPSSSLVRLGRADVGIREELNTGSAIGNSTMMQYAYSRPNGVRALVDDRERSRRGGRSEDGESDGANKAGVHGEEDDGAAWEVRRLADETVNPLTSSQGRRIHFIPGRIAQLCTLECEKAEQRRATSAQCTCLTDHWTDQDTDRRLCRRAASAPCIPSEPRMRPQYGGGAGRLRCTCIASGRCAGQSRRATSNQLGSSSERLRCNGKSMQQ